MQKVQQEFMDNNKIISTLKLFALSMGYETAVIDDPTMQQLITEHDGVDAMQFFRRNATVIKSQRPEEFTPARKLEFISIVRGRPILFGGF